MVDLVRALETVKDDHVFIPGQQIVCGGDGLRGSICAFWAHFTPHAVFANETKLYAHKLIQHGCHKCGSVPYGYPESNDNKYGELTFNFVLTPNTCHTQLDEVLCMHALS